MLVIWLTSTCRQLDSTGRQGNGLGIVEVESGIPDSVVKELQSEAMRSDAVSAALAVIRHLMTKKRLLGATELKRRSGRWLLNLLSIHHSICKTT